MNIVQKIEIKTVYACSHCGKEFDWVVDCGKHEQECTFKTTYNLRNNYRFNKSMWEDEREMKNDNRIFT